MPVPYYSRETIDAKFDALKHELLAAIASARADLRGEIGDLRAAMADLRTELREEIAGLRTDLTSLRAEFKVWLMVMGTILAVLSSGVGNRLLNQIWPAGPAGPPAAQTLR